MVMSKSNSSITEDALKSAGLLLQAEADTIILQSDKNKEITVTTTENEPEINEDENGTPNKAEVSDNDKNDNDPVEAFYRHQAKQRELQNKLPIQDWIHVVASPSSSDEDANNNIDYTMFFQVDKEEESTEMVMKDYTGTSKGESGGSSGTRKLLEKRNGIKDKLKEKMVDRLLNELLIVISDKSY